MSSEICFTPIGTIHSPFTAEEGMPIQGGFSETTGTLELHEQYEDGLLDLEGFSHVVLVFDILP